MKKLFKELIEIDELVGELYSKDKTLENSKFGYAYNRFTKKNISPIVKERNEKILYVRINNALEDKNTKEILKDHMDPVRGYKYSKDGLSKCIEEERKIMSEYEEKEFEVEPYISSLVPEGLSDEQKELLKGILI
jgi:hypothetical protein